MLSELGSDALLDERLQCNVWSALLFKGFQCNNRLSEFVRNCLAQYLASYFKQTIHNSKMFSFLNIKQSLFGT